MDGGWAWVVMAACLLCNTIGGILVYSVGVVNMALLEVYREDKAKTAWVGALHSSLQSLAGPLAGVVVGQLGCRVSMCTAGLTITLGCVLSTFVSSIDALMVTYGLIGGMGLALAHVPSMVAPGFHFQRYRGLASALAITGYGLGILSGGPIIHILLDTYGLRGTFLMLGGLSLHICVLGMLIRTSKLQRQLKQLELEAQRRHALLHGKPSLVQRVRGSILDYLTLFKCYAFACHTLTILLWHVGYAAVMLHLAGYSQSLGSSSAQASALYVGIGAGSLAARLLTGPMLSSAAEPPSSSGAKPRSSESLSPSVDFVHKAKQPNSMDKDTKLPPAEVEIAIKVDVEKNGGNAGGAPAGGMVDPLTLHFAGLGLSGLLTALLPLYCGSYSSQMVFAVLFGLYSGVASTLMTVLPVELAGIDRLVSAFGFESLMMGVGYVMGPPLAGLIIDQGGTYADSLVFSGLITLVASMLSFVTCILHAKFKVEPRLTSLEGVEVKVTAAGSLGFLPPPGSLSFLSSTSSLHFRLADNGSVLLQDGASLRMDHSPLLTRRLHTGLDFKGSGSLSLEKKNGSLGRSVPLLLHGDHLVIASVEEVTGPSPHGVVAPEKQDSAETR